MPGTPPILNRLTNWVLHPCLIEADRETQRRARLTAAFSLLLMSLGPPYVTAFWLLDMPVSVSAVIICNLSIGVGLHSLRRRASLHLAAVLTTLAMFCVVTGVAAASGGIHSAALAWNPVIPVLGMVLSGRRSGMLWLGIIMAQLGAFIGAEATGVPLPMELAEAHRLGSAIAILPGAVLVLSLFAWMSEQVKEEMLQRVDQARAAVDAAHTHSRLLLDNFSEALFVVRADGRIQPGASAMTERWFGELYPQTTLVDLLCRFTPDRREWIDLAWEGVTDGFLPPELSLSQLPDRISRDEQVWELSYTPLYDDDDSELDRILVVARDITRELAAAEAERLQHELLAVCTMMGQDRRGFVEFVEDADRLVADLVNGDDDLDVLSRKLHTLKGNAGIFRLSHIAEVCHGIEERLIQDNEPHHLVRLVRRELAPKWETLRTQIDQILGSGNSGLDVTREEFASVLAMVRAESPAMAQVLETWQQERVSRRFEQYARHIERLAHTLNKGDVTVVLEDRDGLRLPRGPMADVWASFVHLLRNAVDHGLECPEERTVRGKTPAGRIRLAAAVVDGDVVLSIEDDGRGINWKLIQDKAAGLGLPSVTRDDLTVALFCDGLTSRTDLSAVSGRGVGLSALRAAVIGLDGRIEVHSQRGKGTRFDLCIPVGRLGMQPMQQVA